MPFDYGVFLGTIAATFGFFFPFWPVLLLAPLQRRRHYLYNMTVMWGALLLIWVISLFSPYHTKFSLIPEPLNTVLFWATGVALVAIQLGLKYLKRRSLLVKADRASSVEDLRRLSPTEFEGVVVELFTALGHRARRTGAVGDHGVDVEIQVKNGEKWVVQCKRWRGNVGEPVVRDFYGVIQHEKANQGAIITTGKFTPQARDWAKGKPITLLEGPEFLNKLQRARAAAKSTS